MSDENQKKAGEAPKKGVVSTAPGSFEPELTEQEKSQIAAEVAAVLAKEKKAEMRKAYREQVELEERNRLARLVGDATDNELVEFKLNLPKHAKIIYLDGVRYYDAQTYILSRDRFNTIRDIAWGTWKHDLDRQNIRGSDFMQYANSATIGVRVIRDNVPIVA